MIYQVQIKVMPLKDLLDPQGKAVLGGLHNLGLNGVSDVRVGKHITLQIEAASEKFLSVGPVTKSIASTAGPAETADALLAATRASTSSRLRI